MLRGLLFPVQESPALPWAAERDEGLGILTPVGETLQYNYSPVCGSPTQELRDLIISLVHTLLYISL